MNKVEIFNQVDQDILELDEVKKVLYKAMEKENLENTSFNLIIVDNEYIHELNKNYRPLKVHQIIAEKTNLVKKNKRLSTTKD